jgi:regulator of sigma E protease
VDSSNNPDPAKGIKPAGDVKPPAPNETNGKPERAAPPPAPPLTPMGWLTSNGPYLLLILGGGAWLYREYGFDGLFRAGMVILGLGFIIFIHELGHFLAAKWCDVHVQTFSIGFGPALPGCSFQRGETTYKIAVLPLGGYVNMVGEGPEADEEENYPRSFKNKTVGQRMFIISAGVIMNVLLGCVLFVFVYRAHGVERQPAVMWETEPGSRAWEQGVRSGWTLQEINGKKLKYFDDMKVTVALSRPDAPMQFAFQPRQGAAITKMIAPRREDELFPVIGVVAAPKLELYPGFNRKYMALPVAYSSPAAAARPFPVHSGDRVVAATDPAKNNAITPLPEGEAGWSALCNRLEALRGKDLEVRVRRAKGGVETLQISKTGFDFGDRIVGTTDPDTPNDPFQLKELPYTDKSNNRDPFEFRRRSQILAGRPMVIQVVRAKAGKDAAPVNLLVPPAFHLSFGMRMKMGRIAGVREGSPADQAGVTPGDVLSKVRVSYEKGIAKADNRPAGEFTISTSDEGFDPERLPFELNRRISALPNPEKWRVYLTVQRTVNHNAQKEETLKPISWDSSWDGEVDTLRNAPAPLAIPQLGLAYQIDSTVTSVEKGTPADKAGVQKNDRVEQIRFRKALKTLDAPLKWNNWLELKSKRGKEEFFDEWAHVSHELQRVNYSEAQIRVRRDGNLVQLPDEEQAKAAGQDIDTIALIAVPDRTWPVADRGLLLRPDTDLQKADTMLQALSFGVDRTVDFIKQIYLTLSSLLSGGSSAKSLGGPIEIASQAFGAAEDPYVFALFLAIISINLAVVNFLPIPLLDGGHMVFLIYEKLRGKPPSETVRAIASYIGLAMILALMVFALWNDIGRIWPRLFGR